MHQRLINLFDRYTHGGMSRRDFLDRLAILAGGTVAASAVLPLLENNYARAETVAETDPRIAAQTVEIPGVANLKGYLVKPKAGDRHPAVVVIHENRGLNPHIKDVARRLGVEGYLALAVDLLSPIGGTPEDADKAASMIANLKAEDVLADTRVAVAFLKARPDCTGKVGMVGFCWGGGHANALAVSEPGLSAGVVYYGLQPPADKVPGIRAPLLLHSAGLDERINAGIPAYEAALKAAGKTYEIYIYPGVNHAFNNDTNAARYNKEAADLAWSRTLAFLRKYLA